MIKGYITLLILMLLIYSISFKGIILIVIGIAVLNKYKPEVYKEMTELIKDWVLDIWGLISK
jgi:hypothetical protein